MKTLDPNPVSCEDLDLYASQRWEVMCGCVCVNPLSLETVLHFMVGSAVEVNLSDKVLELLRGSDLMAPMYLWFCVNC